MKPRASLLLIAATLSSCDTSQLAEGELDQPLFGRVKETTVIMATPSGRLNIRDAVAVAKVIRKHKNLQAAEKDLIALSMRRKLDMLVALEAQQLERRYAPLRKTIAAMPDRAAARVESAALDERIKREAIASVLARLGPLAALPVRAASDRSVVAFGKLDADGVRVADATFELDGPPSVLQAEARITLPSGIDPETLAPVGAGRRTATASVLDTEPVQLKP